LAQQFDWRFLFFIVLVLERETIIFFLESRKRGSINLFLMSSLILASIMFIYCARIVLFWNISCQCLIIWVQVEAKIWGEPMRASRPAVEYFERKFLLRHKLMLFHCAIELFWCMWSYIVQGRCSAIPPARDVCFGCCSRCDRPTYSPSRKVGSKEYLERKFLCSFD
jgi:hypothetical protein